MAPLRSLLNFCLDRRGDYGQIDIIYGARTPGDLCFTNEFEDWRSAPDTSLYLTVDKGGPGWEGKVGLVPAYLQEIAPALGRRGGHHLRPAHHDQVHPASSWRSWASPTSRSSPRWR